MEQAYYSHEIEESTGLKNSTLRKYCGLLEEKGYRFDRGRHNARVFYDKDRIILKRIVAVMKERGIAVEQAIELAIASTQQTDVATAATVEQADNNVLDRLGRIEQTQDAILKHLQEEAEERKRERREQRERDARRDAQFMSIIRAMQEEKRLIAASKQYIPLWKRLFWWRK